MTVRELIGELTTMPQDMEAWVYAEDAEYVSAPVIFAERAGRSRYTPRETGIDTRRGRRGGMGLKASAAAARPADYERGAL